MGVLSREQERNKYWEDRLRDWWDVDLIDDSPYQPPFRIDEKKLGSLVESLNEHGQLQAALIRPHPLRPGRFQSAEGHRRKYAIRAGANGAPADVPQSDRWRFIGKLRCEVRELTDEQMVNTAFQANGQREDFTVIDHAYLLMKLREVAESPTPGKLLSFEDLEAMRKLPVSARHAHRIVAALRLPETLQRELMDINLSEREDHVIRIGEKHVRALVSLQPIGKDMLKEAPTRNQKRLLNVIKRDRISGNEAMRQADELRGKMTASHDQQVLDTIAEGQETAAQQSREQTLESNRQAVTNGTSHLSLVGNAPTANAEATTPATPVDTQSGTGFVQSQPEPDRFTGATVSGGTQSSSTGGSRGSGGGSSTSSGTSAGSTNFTKDFLAMSAQLDGLTSALGQTVVEVPRLAISVAERDALRKRLENMQGQVQSLDAALAALTG